MWCARGGYACTESSAPLAYSFFNLIVTTQTFIASVWLSLPARFLTDEATGCTQLRTRFCPALRETKQPLGVAYWEHPCLSKMFSYNAYASDISRCNGVNLMKHRWSTFLQKVNTCCNSCRLRALWIRAETVVAFTRSRFLTSAVATNVTRKDHVAWITVKTCYNEDTSMMMW